MIVGRRRGHGRRGRRRPARRRGRDRSTARRTRSPTALRRAVAPDADAGRHRREPRAGRASGARCSTTSDTPSRRARSRSSPTRTTRACRRVPRRASRRADHDPAARHQDDPGHVVRQHDHVHARGPRRARARRRPDHRVARRGVRQRDRAVHPPRSSTAPITTDHVNLVQPLERRPQSLDHEGRADLRRRTRSCRSRSTRRRAPRRARRSRSGRAGSRTLEIKITERERPPAQAVRRRRRASASPRSGSATSTPTHDVRVDEVEQMPQDLLDALGAQPAAHPLGPRDVARRAAPGAAAHRSGAVDLAHVHAADRADVRAHRQREREPGRERRGDRRRARRARHGHRRGERVAAGLPAVPRRERGRRRPARRRGTRRSSASAASGCSSDSPKPITFSNMHLQVVADGRHSDADADRSSRSTARVRELDPPADHAARAENATQRVPLHFPAMTGRTIRVTITGVQPQLATRESTGDTVDRAGRHRRARHQGLRVGAAPATVPERVPFRPRRRSTAGRYRCASRPARRRVATRPGSRSTPCDPRDPERHPDDHARARHARRADVGGCAHRRADRPPRARVRRGRRAAGGRRRSRDRARRRRRRPRRRSRSCTTARRACACTSSGADAPFWLVLGESQSPGWHATIVGQGDARPVAARRRLRERLAASTRSSRRSTSCSSGRRSARCGPRSGSRCSRARVPRDHRSGRSSRRRTRLRSTAATRPTPTCGSSGRCPTRGVRTAAGAARGSWCRSSLGLLAALIVAPWAGRRSWPRSSSRSSGGHGCGRCWCSRRPRCSRSSRVYIVVFAAPLPVPAGVRVAHALPARPAARLARGRVPRRSTWSLEQVRGGPAAPRPSPVIDPSARAPIRDNHPCSRSAISPSKSVAGSR